MMTIPSIITFLSIASGLSLIVHFSPFPLLIAQRLAGIEATYIEIICIATYGAWITSLMNIPGKRAKTRKNIWLLFTLVFFMQLTLGLWGFEDFLQTGKLHYPIPTLMISGPIFRGGGFFMVGLFLTTILLAGPSWCSHLCYIGSIDNWLAQGVRKKSFHPSLLLKNLRYLTLITAIITPIVLIRINVGTDLITITLIVFIMISLGMFIFSWKQKLATHCSFFCPVSLIVNFLSKINPFRLEIASSCDRCQKCQQMCKYYAISNINQDLYINSRCTLCMDCTSKCHNNSIHLSLFRKIKVNYNAFYIITITFHCIFIAVARI